MSLGRGLDSLIPKKTVVLPTTPSTDAPDQTVGGERIIQVPPADIVANQHQPRTQFDHGGLEELIQSVKEHGILQPLIVTKTASGYELIAGERRLRAATAAELPTVPVIVRDASANEKLELALIENVQRRDLNPIEEAVAYQRLLDEFSMTQEAVAQRIGKSRAVIANMLRLLDLPEEVRQAISDGVISPGHAKVLAGLDDSAEQKKFFQKIVKEKLSVRDVEAAVRAKKPGGAKKLTAASPLAASAEEQLRAALGTKVAVSEKAGQGTVTIEFYSAEELHELVERVAGRQSVDQ